MNKFVTGALAVTLVGTTGFASDSEWPELDRELEALSSTLSAQGSGPNLSGWGIVGWNFSGDDPYLVGGEDHSGAAFESIRVNVEGGTAGYAYHLSFDLASGSAELLDAYGRWDFSDNLHGQIGNFRKPFLQSGLLDRNRTVMIRRTNIALSMGMGLVGNLVGRDTGVQIDGDFEQIAWAIAVQNGADSVADEYLLTGRVSVDIMGEGAGQWVEGAYNAPDGTNLSVGLAFCDDGFYNDGSRIGLEAYLTNGPFAASAEVVDNDTDVGDNTPWDATFSWMFNDMWEAALRWEDRDDTADTNDLTLGVNRYVSGHDAKWQLNWRSSDSDSAAIDGDLITLALAVSF
ncbi:MAG: hypothetical protein KDB35_06540 [Acidimicrobiales bacterium]|nr:hypothetical protein [Acidimicrobiales bacterium]